MVGVARMADVFVSYKKEERATALLVVAALQAAGYSVWWDDDLTPRASWDAEIEQEIFRAKAVLVLWSPASVAESSFVRREASYAQDHGKLVPAWIERCALPLRFRDIQTADLSGWDRTSQAHREWRRVLSWIADLAGATPPAQLAQTEVVAKASTGERQPQASAQAGGKDQDTLLIPLVLGVLTLLLVASRSIYSVALQPVIQEFGLADSQVAIVNWISTGFVIGAASIAAVVLDRGGSRRVLLVAGLALGVVSLGVHGIANNLVELLGARALGAIGAGLFLTAAVVRCGESALRQNRALTLSILGAAMAVGPSLPSVGANLIELLGWRSIFLVGCGILLFASVLLILTPDRSSKDARMEPIEQASGLALFLIVVGVVSHVCMMQVSGALFSLLRERGVPLSSFGFMAVALFAGAFLSVLVAWMLDRTRLGARGLLYGFAGAALVSGPILVMVAIAPTVFFATTLAAVLFSVSWIWFGLAHAALQTLSVRKRWGAFAALLIAISAGSAQVSTLVIRPLLEDFGSHTTVIGFAVLSLATVLALVLAAASVSRAKRQSVANGLPNAAGGA
jgi:MFS family permease